MNNPPYHAIVRHYEKCLTTHGVSYKGMDWPNESDLITRFNIMLGVIRNWSRDPVSLLDLGCGSGLLLNHLDSQGLLETIDYWGIDLSGKMISAARTLHPQNRFEERDILQEPLLPQCVDYVIMNGVLTEKVSLNQESMENYARSLIAAAYRSCRKGIAFNVMSIYVDWYRDDLFHWSMDKAIAVLVAECSRNIVIRMDYGLYEYTVYVYREVADECEDLVHKTV